VDDPDENIIRNIPASVMSDIERIDEAINTIGDMADSAEELNWKNAETILDALGDARTCLLYLAEKHDKLVVRLQELEL
jgi:hypothetical protein